MLNPAQSYILVDADLVKGFDSSGQYMIPEREKELISLTGDWTGTRLDANALTLDFARYSIDNGKTFSKPEPVLAIHERFSEKVVQWSAYFVI